MNSIQTNVDSINAQNNLGINNSFQSKTIQQLTSGYRINNSADDAAGLAIANGYRDQISELNQGINNANNGISQLQIVDGGLADITTILDRMKTLATQSASGTFTGDRSTLNQEYQNLITELTRQATNINLNSGGLFNSKLTVYIGGANPGDTTNANINVDLSGAANAVDATSLNLNATNILAGGIRIAGNTQRLDAPGALFLTGATQNFTFNVFSNGTASTITVPVAGGAGGANLASVLSQLNGKLNAYGITAGIDANGLLQFSGGTAFTVSAAGTGLTSAAGTGKNTANYTIDGAASYGTLGAGDTDTLTFQTVAGSVSVALSSTDNVNSAIAAINGKTATLGVYAVLNAAGTGISFQSANSFSISDSVFAGGAHAAEGAFGYAPGAGGTFLSNNVSTPPATTTANTGNAQAAIAAINTAIQAVGLVQGRVGAGENQLNYAISLANSQVANLSAAQSSIRDANVAQAAANLTKSQVLTQTSIAAMAQANSEPQAVLKLLQQ